MRMWEVAWTVWGSIMCVFPRQAYLTPIMPSHINLKADDSDRNNIDSRHHRGRHQPGLHPVPSDSLPVIPPSYPLGERQSLPSGEDLNPRKLQRLLGGEYDPMFMSSQRPLESIISPNGTFVYHFKNDHPDSDMPRQLRKLAFSLPGSRQKYRINSRKTRKTMRNYLWTYTFCPVNYRWRDLGDRFWPRWIREGDCDSGRSCSIPAGMTCKQRQRTHKTILWWHCRLKSCYWIEIQYPIIIQCGCSC